MKRNEKVRESTTKDKKNVKSYNKNVARQKCITYNTLSIAIAAVSATVVIKKASKYNINNILLDRCILIERRCVFLRWNVESDLTAKQYYSSNICRFFFTLSAS